MSGPSLDEPVQDTVESAGAVLELEVSLLDIEPEIWRHFLVSDKATLEDLHGILQVVMGWEGYHLYQFDFDHRTYGSWQLMDTDSPDVSLDSLRLNAGDRLMYAYDMGDYWLHEIVVVDRVAARSGMRYPVCVEGAGRCPAEDSGGPAAYHARRRRASRGGAAGFAKTSVNERLRRGEHEWMKDQQA